MASPEVEEVLPGHKSLIAVGADATGLRIDDVPEVCEGRAVDGEHAVDLLLVLGEVHLCPTVGEQVLHLGRGIGRVEADGDTADRHRCEVQDEPLGTVLRLDRDAVTGFDAERQ